MIYSAGGKVFTVRLEKLSGVTIRAHWYDPRTGRATAAGEFSKAGLMKFTPLAGGAEKDWVLVLDDAAKNYPPPGERYMRR